MKYKVGDRVIVKSLYWYIKNRNINGNVIMGPHFIPGMAIYCGKWYKIEYVDNDNNIYKLKGVGWNWCDEFFEDIKEIRKNKLNKILDTNEI